MRGRSVTVGCLSDTHGRCLPPSADRIHRGKAALCKPPALLIKPVRFVARDTIEIVDALADQLVQCCIHTDQRVLQVVNLQEVAEVTVRAEEGAVAFGAGTTLPSDPPAACPSATLTDPVASLLETPPFVVKCASDAAPLPTAGSSPLPISALLLVIAAVTWCTW